MKGPIAIKVSGGDRGQMGGRAMSIVAVLLVALAASFAASSSVKAAAIGSNLATPANDSVCKFQSLEPETRVCTVSQSSLLGDHAAASGLKAPFDGFITRWSVVTGAPLPGTGVVKLAPRTVDWPEYSEKGPEVELPPSPPGTRHTFAVNMPIYAGRSIGLHVSVANRSAQEAGAPIAVREEGLGTLDMWAGEPLRATLEPEDGVELLLDAEIEPDADRDGFADLTRDCFPNHFGDQELCGRDFVAPTIQPRFAARQNFLRTGAILVWVSSNEAGVARAVGRLEIKGHDGGNYDLSRARGPVAANGETLLRLRVPETGAGGGQGRLAQRQEDPGHRENRCRRPLR